MGLFSQIQNFISPQLSQMPSPVPQQNSGNMLQQLGRSGRQIISNVANLALLHPQNIVPFTAQTDPGAIVSRAFNQNIATPVQNAYQQAQSFFNKAPQPRQTTPPVQVAQPSPTPTVDMRNIIAAQIRQRMAQAQQAPANVLSQAQQFVAPVQTQFSKTANTLPNFAAFEQLAAPILQKYGIPLAVGIGQAAAENRMPGQAGWDRNNFYNIAAFDSNPLGMVRYQTPEQGIEAYAKLMSGQFKKADGTVDTRYLPAYQMRSNPVAMLKAIHAAGYASRPDYVQLIMNTPEWRKYLQNNK